MLPSDAVDTGYHTPKRRLFTIPGGDAVFVQTEAVSSSAGPVLVMTWASRSAR